MKPASFGYARPATLDEAVELLATHGSDATVLAGGVSLGAMLNMRLVRPQILLDVKGIAALESVRAENGHLMAGATVRQAEAMRNAAMMRVVPLLALAFPHIGHMQTRGRGTLGGSIAHADPSAELPLCLATLDGALTLQSTRGFRTVQARHFFTGVLSTARQPDELLTAVHWPMRGPRSGSGFDEIAQRPGDFAIVAAACMLRLDDQDGIARLDVGVGGVEDRPLAFTLPELAGARPDARTARTVADLIVERVRPFSDAKATAQYRNALVRLLVERVVMQAAAAARASLSAGDMAGPYPSGANTGSARQMVAAHSKATIELSLNGQTVRGSAEPRMLLSDFLRHECGAYGVRVGCEHGVCGACTVLVNGVAQRSCLQRAVEAQGASITTVEGLSPAEGLSPLQDAFRRNHALQCGFCTPGILASATQFLRENANPSEGQVRDMLSGHICRCTGYHGIVQAILDAAGQARAQH